MADGVMRRAEQGLEWLVVLVIVGSGVALGLLASSWTILAIGALAIGILLNAALLVRVAFATGNRDRLSLAIAGSLPAGAFDALKVFAFGSVVRYLASVVSLRELAVILAILLIAIGWIWTIRLKRGVRNALRTRLGIPWWAQIIVGGLLLWALIVWGR